MKTVVRLLPIGNVTVTHPDWLTACTCVCRGGGVHRNTHTHADEPRPACADMFTLQPVPHMHIQTDMSGSRVSVCWHIYIRARLSWSGAWFGVTGLMLLPLGQCGGAEPQRDRDRGREMPFIHRQPLVTQLFPPLVSSLLGSAVMR